MISSNSGFIGMFHATGNRFIVFLRAWMGVIALLRTKFTYPIFRSPGMSSKFIMAVNALVINPILLMFAAMLRFRKHFKVFNTIVICSPVFVMEFCSNGVWLSMTKPPNNMSTQSIPAFIRTWVVWTINPESPFAVFVSHIPFISRPDLDGSQKRSVFISLCFHSALL